MKNRIIQGFAGTMVLISLTIFYLTMEPNWLWVAAFVGANLLQSAFTKWCLLGIILEKLHVKN